MALSSGSSVLTKDARLSWLLSMAKSLSTLSVVATRLASKSSRAWAPVESLRVQLLVLGDVEQRARDRVVQ